jgi:two-component system, OmpR family, phosphate regulon response regulator PhoB
VNDRRPAAMRDTSSNGAARVLIVEDDHSIAQLLMYNLEVEGFIVEHVDRGEEAELRLAKALPDLVILDWILPDVSGLEICRRLRAHDKTRDMPVIMLTVCGEESERVRGFQAGADDYVVKPFSMLEFIERVRALLRRRRPKRLASKLTAGDIEVDRSTYRVYRAGREVHLSSLEFHLLEFFMENPGRVFTRAQLAQSVWQLFEEPRERTVDVRVGRLRKALTRGRQIDPIRTVRGVGYGFDETFVRN